MAGQDRDEAQDGAGQAGPTLAFDPASYAAELDRFDITEAQKHELLSTLWSIMRSFVELGFTVDVCAALLQDSVLIRDDGKVG